MQWTDKIAENKCFYLPFTLSRRAWEGCNRTASVFARQWIRALAVENKDRRTYKNRWNRSGQLPSIGPLCSPGKANIMSGGGGELVRTWMS
ncbi:hypothetical protein TNCV_1033921 [Trichonephila clavipes]|nr:hypothetical protein TNCV_1033921 [Trichonephila clavipes]